MLRYILELRLSLIAHHTQSLSTEYLSACLWYDLSGSLATWWWCYCFVHLIDHTEMIITSYIAKLDARGAAVPLMLWELQCSELELLGWVAGVDDQNDYMKSRNLRVELSVNVLVHVHHFINHCASIVYCIKSWFVNPCPVNGVGKLQSVNEVWWVGLVMRCEIPPRVPLVIHCCQESKAFVHFEPRLRP